MSRQSGAGNRIGLLAIVLAMPLLFAACPKEDPPPRPSASVSTSSRPVIPSPPAVVAAFNGERAMDHVRKQIDFGPRPPDTQQLAKTRAYITNELKSYGLNVSLDEFNATTPQGEKKMANIVAEIPGETNTLILITSHYDTKFYKDMHFVGANDPAASVATLLEIGRVLGSARRNQKRHTDSCSSMAKRLSAKAGLNVETKRILTTRTAVVTMFRSCARKMNWRIQK